MKEVNWWKIAVFIIAVILLFGLGFYIGRKKDPEVIIKEKIKYVELPPVHDTIDNPVPVYVNKPADTLNILKALIKSGKYSELFPERVRDSIVYVTKDDTTAVIADWATERLYKETLFDNDTLGRFDLNAKVQYNRLQGLEYNYKPMQKQTETTVKTTRKYLPYIGAGFDTGKCVLGQAGMFFHQDAGFAIQYRYDTQLKQSQFGGLFLYMF